ncbi:MAG: Rrf2 family transcriptional regulator [Candidatus Omnitrophota bacterium]
MKLPAKIEYACKAIMELALHYHEGSSMQLKEIAKAQGIPKQFLVQLMIRMKNAGLVDSKRGVVGGYFLTKPPAHLSLADIFRAVDDSILNSNEKTKLIKASDVTKIISFIWEGINKDIATRLESTSLDWLASQINKEQLIYHI